VESGVIRHYAAADCILSHADRCDGDDCQLLVE
jgi:hypothetical protein